MVKVRNLIPRGPMVTASGYDVSYFCNQKIPGSSPGGEDFFFATSIQFYCLIFLKVLTKTLQ